MISQKDQVHSLLLQQVKLQPCISNLNLLPLTNQVQRVNEASTASKQDHSLCNSKTPLVFSITIHVKAQHHIQLNNQLNLRVPCLLINRWLDRLLTLAKPA